MKYVFASRTGNVEYLMSKLGLADEAIRINDGSEEVNEPYILFTYTDGMGDIPYEVDTFLQSGKNKDFIKGVVCSGDKNYGDCYCGAGDKISEQYGVPCFYKLENDGTDEDVANVKAILEKNK